MVLYRSNAICLWGRCPPLEWSNHWGAQRSASEQINPRCRLAGGRRGYVIAPFFNRSHDTVRPDSFQLETRCPQLAGVRPSGIDLHAARSLTQKSEHTRAWVALATANGQPYQFELLRYIRYDCVVCRYAERAPTAGQGP
jgi:hypothetical protein